MDTSAEARVVAAFTFIVVLMLGAWTALDHHLAAGPDPLFGEPEPGRLIITLLPVAATFVALKAGRAAQAAWARTLGGAAVMLGVLASLGAVLYFVTSW